MQKLQIIPFLILFSLFFQSCRLGLIKRRYQPGYYLNLPSSKQSSALRLADNSEQKLNVILKEDVVECLTSNKRNTTCEVHTVGSLRKPPNYFHGNTGRVNGSDPLRKTFWSKDFVELNKSNISRNTSDQARPKWMGILLLSVGFAIILFVELLLPESTPSILSLLLVMVLLIALLLLYKYIFNMRNAGTKKNGTN